MYIMPIIFPAIWKKSGEGGGVGRAVGNFLVWKYDFVVYCKMEINDKTKMNFL